MSKSTTDERLRTIYDGVLDAIVRKIKDHPEEVTAADLQAYRAILRDNGVTGIPAPGSKLEETVSAVEELDTNKFPFAVDVSLLPEADPAVKAVGDR